MAIRMVAKPSTAPTKLVAVTTSPAIALPNDCGLKTWFCAALNSIFVPLPQYMRHETCCILSRASWIPLNMYSSTRQESPFLPLPLPRNKERKGAQPKRMRDFARLRRTTVLRCFLEFGQFDAYDNLLHAQARPPICAKKANGESMCQLKRSVGYAQLMVNFCSSHPSPSFTRTVSLWSP